MSTIPASQLDQVLPGVLAPGGAAIDLNGLVLTTNTRIPIGTVASFASQAAVASFFGATDPMALGAAVYFNGYDNSLAKPGALLAAQYNTGSVSAYLRGGNISALPLATLQGYSGTLSVTIDGSLKTGSVNLSAATSFSNAAEIIAQTLAITGTQAASVTGSIGGTFGTCTTSGTTLTLGTVTTGSLWPGDTVTATDGTNTLNTTIVSQLTGTAGGSAGATFRLTAAASPGNLGSSTVTAVSTVLNVATVVSGAIAVADVISGTGIAANTYVASFGTGVGGVGTYNLSGAQQRDSTGTEAITVFNPAVQYDSVSGAFVVLSGTAGASSTITFGSGAMATNLLLAAALGATISAGAIAAVPSTFMNAVIALTTNWALFTTAFDPDGGSGFANKLLFSTWANGQNNRYGYVGWDTDPNPALSVPATSSFGYAVTQANLSGTFPVSEPSDLLHEWFVLGWAASLNFTASAGRATLAFRSQSGLVPGVTTGQAAINLGGNPQTTADRGNGYNFYGTYGSGNANFTFMQRGFVSGPFLWADSFVNQIWLNNNLQVALVSYQNAAGATPFTTAGLSKIDQALAAPIAAALNFGVFVPGVTLSASQISQINTAAGANIAATLAARGWYLQLKPATPTVRAARGPLQGTFYYCDGESVQSVNLGSIAVL